MICREADCSGKLRLAEPGAPGWEYMMICSECLTLQELKERADGDVCPGCGGVFGEPEPSDLDHPYYSCPDCAGGA